MEEIDVDSMLEKITRADRASDLPVAIMEKCLNIMVEAMDTERGVILLYDPDFNYVSPIAVHNMDAETFFSSPGLSISVIDTVYNENRSLMTYDAKNDPRFSDKLSVILTELRSFLCVPIKNEEGLLGILYVDDRSKTKAFTHRHLAILESCAVRLSEVIRKRFPDLEAKTSKVSLDQV